MGRTIFFVAIDLFPQILKRLNPFGKNSYFEYLVSQNFKLLSLGVKFSKGITPFIHAERLANVPYREEKFDGKILHNGNTRHSTSTHFC